VRNLYRMTASTQSCVLLDFERHERLIIFHIYLQHD
jgi:hypothetical protein